MKNTFFKMQLIVCLLILILSFVGLFFFYKNINQKNETVLTKALAWKTEAQKREEIKSLDRSVKLIEPERLELESHFAFSSNIVPFLDTIEGFGPKVGIESQVTSVDLSKDQNSLVVGLKASGSFTGIYKYITLLENSPYELDFMSMQLSRDGASSTTNTNKNWTAAIKINLLSFVK